MIKLKIKKALYDNFIVGDLTEERINLFFSNQRFSIVNERRFGMKTITVYTELITVMFLEHKEETLILLLTGLNITTFNNKHICSSSTMKIDIISSKIWEVENKEIIEITNFVSNNTFNIPKEVYIYGTDRIIDFKDEYLTSPILHILSRNNGTRFDRYKRESTKTKNSFLNNLLIILSNSLKEKESIDTKDLSNIKRKFYTKVLSKMIRSEISRNILLDDLENRGLSTLMNFVGTELTNSVSYNKEEWLNFINQDLKNSFQYDFVDFVFNQMTQENIEKEVLTSISSYTYEGSLVNSRDSTNKIFEKIIEFSTIYFNKELFKNTKNKYSSNTVNVKLDFDLDKEIPVEMNDAEIPF